MTNTAVSTNHALLDRPVWSAFSGPLREFSAGNTHAVRAAKDVGPLAATRDDSPEALAALAQLAPERGTIGLMQAGPAPAPDTLNVLGVFPLIQLLASEPLASSPIDQPITPLDTTHAPAMQALAAVTKPGPFFARTHMLGHFWGIWIDTHLVAMAGERLKMPGYTEVSGVCTHPDYRGRGYAKALMAKVADGIFARGDKPILHAYADNPALPLYHKLGFAHRADFTMKWLAKPGAGTAIFGR